MPRYCRYSLVLDPQISWNCQTSVILGRGGVEHFKKIYSEIPFSDGVQAVSNKCFPFPTQFNGSLHTSTKNSVIPETSQNVFPIGSVPGCWFPEHTETLLHWFFVGLVWWRRPHLKNMSVYAPLKTTTGTLWPTVWLLIGRAFPEKEKKIRRFNRKCSDRMF